jgi:hypothetical protein
MSVVRFPIERVSQRRVFAADAVVVVLPKRRRDTQEDMALLCDESLRLVARSFDLLFAVLRGERDL